MSPEPWESLGAGRVRVRHAGSDVTVELRSDFDLAELPRLSDFCKRLLLTLGRSVTVVLDFTEVTFVGSGGLRVLEQFCKDVVQIGGTLQVIAPTGTIVRKLLELDLHQLLHGAIRDGSPRSPSESA